MKIQYVSDIHLEMMESYDLHQFLEAFEMLPDADVLVLAGDIGNPFSTEYKGFLTDVSKWYDAVYVVPGNHEYYKSSILSAKRQMRQVVDQINDKSTDPPRLHLLDNGFHDYAGSVRFVGSTQWTRVKDPQYTINDTKQILNFSPAEYDALHSNAIDFLEQAIQESPLPVIVITHHLPSFQLTLPEFQTAHLANYHQWFSADLDDMINYYSSKIKAWFYGHTHKPSVQTLHDVTFYCNPLGYPWEGSYDTLNTQCDLCL